MTITATRPTTVRPAAHAAGSQREHVLEGTPRLGHQVKLRGERVEGSDTILTPGAIAFIVQLDAAFAERRCALLAERRRRRARLSAGADLSFRPETAHIRADDTWQTAPVPPGLVDRRVEITGPTDRKMTINALNSGASVWLADFEDACAPTWANVIGGQRNLVDALDGKIDFVSEDGKTYELGSTLPTIVVRPRGWHLVERHLLVDGRPVSASLVDFGLYLYHCAQRQLERGLGPYFYLPKLENHLEARLWNDVFGLAQDLLGLPRGTIRATVLIETITAAYEMDEILYELRDHVAGLNAGRWDYIFSVIKNFGDRGGEFVLSDRADVTMTTPFMRAYTDLLVQTCHRRGTYAIGGMAATVPDRRDPERNELALAKVRADKEREAADGFDGSWVAHPDLVPVCREAFDAVLGDAPNQIDRRRNDVTVSAADLVTLPPTQVSLAGVRTNVHVLVAYLAAWLGGAGAVAIDGLMEDMATAEIARAQLWQWRREGIRTAEGALVTHDLLDHLLDRELALAREREGQEAFARLHYTEATEIISEAVLGEEFPPFLTVGAYARYLR